MNSKKGKLLIADTEKTVNDSLKEYFTIKGFSVCIASSEEEVMDILSNKSVDIVIIDIRIEGSGSTTVNKIKEIDRNAKIVVTTTDTGENPIDKAIELGAEKYMTKPVRLGELTEFVETRIVN